jgi:hypothetical protein
MLDFMNHYHFYFFHERPLPQKIFFIVYKADRSLLGNEDSQVSRIFLTNRPCLKTIINPAICSPLFRMTSGYLFKQ